MAARGLDKKRKSDGDTARASKKAKTAKSADKSAPLKSALKKSRTASAHAAPRTSTEEIHENDVELATREDNGGVELTEDQTAALIAGFSSSEDEAEDDEEKDGIAVDKLPAAPRTQEIQRQIKAAVADDPESVPGTIYIGRIPHGFYETQMRAYFSQFGDVVHIRLARNKKTGKSKHYGFIEFASRAVAEIVAKTMDKYLMFGHILQVRVVPQEQIKEDFWKSSGKRKKPAPRNRLEGARLKRGMVREDWEKKVEREQQKRKDKALKLREMGYDFEMPSVKSVDDVPVKAKAVMDVPDSADQQDRGEVTAGDQSTYSVQPSDGAAAESTKPVDAPAQESGGTAKRPAAEAKRKSKKAKVTRT